MNRRKQHLLGYNHFITSKSQFKYNAGKSYKGKNMYNKNTSLKTRQAIRTPELDVKVVEKVQNKNMTHESKISDPTKSQSRARSSKYKGKPNNYLKSRKRSLKRTAKEQDTSEEPYRRVAGIPPKSHTLRQANREWIESVPHKLTENEKSYLLSINDQSDRNKELSSMIEGREHSSRGNLDRLAGQPSRKSKIKLRNFGNQKKYDEIHFEKAADRNKMQKFQKVGDNDNESDAKGIIPTLDITKQTIEVIHNIRARGKEAKERRSTQICVKRTPPKSESEGQSSKISPVHFSLSPALKNNCGNSDRFGSNLICDKIDAKMEVSPQHVMSTQDSDKPLEIIEKVQGIHKDVSVSIVKEIQPKEVVFKNVETFPPVSLPELSTQLPPCSDVLNREVVEQVKDTNKGLKRTPAKLTNRVIYSSPHIKMEQQSNPGSEFKTPLPKRARSVSASRTPPSSQKNIVNTFSMRKYSEVQRKEYDEILLPKNFQLVLDFFTELDNAINNCKRRGKIPIFSNLKPYVEQQTNRTFTKKSFQKVLYCAPDLYYYTWQTMDKTGEYDLRIEIPENIENILSSIEKKATVVNLIKLPLSDVMTNYILNKRNKLVRARLMQYTTVIHSQYLKSINQSNYDFIQNRGWHPDFSPEGGADIPAK